MSGSPTTPKDPGRKQPSRPLLRWTDSDRVAALSRARRAAPKGTLVPELPAESIDELMTHGVEALATRHLPDDALRTAWESDDYANVRDVVAALGSRIVELEAELEAHRPWKASMEMQGKSIRELMRHVSELERSLEDTREERDTARAEVEGLKAQLAERDAAVDEWLRREGEQRQRAERAEADNAKLVQRMKNTVASLRKAVDEEKAKTRPSQARVMEWMHALVLFEQHVNMAHLHPGAALLEEHRKALEHERQRADLAEAAHAVTADAARVALVRARNEALEKAAERCDRYHTQLLEGVRANASDTTLVIQLRYRAGVAKVLAADIRAMQESES